METGKTVLSKCSERIRNDDEFPVGVFKLMVYELLLNKLVEMILRNVTECLSKGIDIGNTAGLRVDMAQNADEGYQNNHSFVVIIARETVGNKDREEFKAYMRRGPSDNTRSA